MYEQSSGDQFESIMLFNWSPDELAYMHLTVMAEDD